MNMLGRSINYPNKCQQRVMIMPLAFQSTVLLVLLISSGHVSGNQINDVSASSTGQWNSISQLLETEKILIDSLKSYTNTFESQLNIIKSTIEPIKEIHKGALKDTEKYVNNPINGVTLVRRFTTIWKEVLEYAGSLQQKNEIMRDIGEQIPELKFPTEDELDSAMANLLRIQSIYKLESKGLAAGEIHGNKIGSEMTWSDCLEIGRKSHTDGDLDMAKYWLEAAMDKVNVSKVNVSPKMYKAIDDSQPSFDILKALLNVEFENGDWEAALRIGKQMLSLKPTNEGVLEAIHTIERKMEKKFVSKKVPKQHGKNEKSGQVKGKTNIPVEEEIIRKICHDITLKGYITSSPDDLFCTIEHKNLPQLFLRPLFVEILSLDPYIAVYHEAIHLPREFQSQARVLQNSNVDENVDVHPLTLMPLDVNIMSKIRKQLQIITGHSMEQISAMTVQNFNFEDDSNSEDDEDEDNMEETQAKILFKLKSATLGGGIVFPQLDASVNLPQSSVLYWSNLNEFKEPDYRSEHSICPVIVGTQIVASFDVKQGQEP